MNTTTASPPINVAVTARRLNADALVGLALVIAVVGRCGYLLFGPMSGVSYRLTDDAYYYFQTARHIVSGSGVTFDGINATNGFHPLWMALLLPFFAVTRSDPDASLRLVSVVMALMAGGAFWICWHAVSRSVGTLAGVVALLMLAHPVMVIDLLNGLESGLVILLLFGAMWLDQRRPLFRRDEGRGWRVLAGGVLGIIFLCRLDTAFIVIGLMLLVWLLQTHRPLSRAAPVEMVKRYWPAAAGFVVLTLPYLTWNKVRFGHLMPISGALKTSFPVPVLDVDKLFAFQWLPYTAFIGVSTAWVGMSLLMPGSVLRGALARWRSEGRLPLIAVLWLGCVMHYGYSALFSKWAAFYWHFASYVPVMVLMAAMTCQRVAEWLRRPRGVMRVAVGLSLGAVVVSTMLERRERGVHHGPRLEAAEWVRENLPPDAVIGMTDCGMFGYFCRRTTVNLDGVINGYEFQRALAEGDLPAYLARCGMTHLADYEVREDRRDQHRMYLPARLADRPGYIIEVTREGEAWASAPYRQRELTRSKPPFFFVIWNFENAKVYQRTSG